MGDKRYVLVTERSMGVRESRVVHEELRLRNVSDALAIRNRIRDGRLRTRSGVRAWIESR